MSLRTFSFIRKRKEEANAKRLQDEADRKRIQQEQEKQAKEAIMKKREHFRGLFQKALADGFEVDLTNNELSNELQAKVKDEKNNIEIAKNIEEALFKLNNNELSQDHARNLRTLIYNLKDKKNADLRKRIISGALSASKLVRLDPEELANQDIVRLREEQDKAALQSSYRDRELVDELNFGIKVDVREEAPKVPARDGTVETSASPDKPAGLRLSGSGSYFGNAEHETNNNNTEDGPGSMHFD